MNIFILNEDPSVAAKAQCDKHCVKMILESAQMLCTAHRVLDGKMVIKKSKNNRNVKTWILDDDRDGVLYKSAHVNHPCSIWVRECYQNYEWLFNHYVALMDEFEYRFNKVHASRSLEDLLQYAPIRISPLGVCTPFAIAINEDIYPGVKSLGDAVTCYQEYYRRKNAEQFEMKWSKRSAPTWF